MSLKIELITHQGQSDLTKIFNVCDDRLNYLYGHYMSAKSIHNIGCIIFTLVTGIYDTFMICLLMSLKINLLCCLLLTLVTGIYDTFVFRLLVNLKMTMSCCMILTLITRESDNVMFRLSMPLQIIRYCCLFWEG